MTDDLHDFEQFMKRREAAAEAYTRGDAAPLGQLVARAGDATFFGPGGGSVQGADAVFSAYEQGAKAFAPGGESHLEILQMGASEGLAFWVGFQRATTRMHGRSEPVAFDLRITEVFRREGNEWKLIHRHADPLMSKSS